MVHLYNEILLSYKKEWNNAIFNNMDGPGDYYTKWSRKEKEKYLMMLHIYVESKTWQMNFSMKQKQMHRHRKTCHCWRWGIRGLGEGHGLGVGVSSCKLLHLEWINNKVLLYRTGNYIQYPVINYNGKKYRKECIYM